MPTTIQRSTAQRKKSTRQVRPSIVEPVSSKPFTLEQELEPFGHWVERPIWVPPKDSSQAMAQTMLKNHGPLDLQRSALGIRY